MTKKPMTSIDLMRNLKFTFDNHLLLDKDFYTSENLKALFGVQKITWRVENDSTKQWIYLSDFSTIAETVTVGENSFESISFSIERTERDDGQVTGHAHLFIHNDEKLKFENIEEIFGRNWKPSQVILSPHLILLPPTQKHGNAYITYKLEEDKIKMTLDMIFSANATLQTMNFTEEKR